MSFRQRHAGRTVAAAVALLMAACGSPVPSATPANGPPTIPVSGSLAPRATPGPTAAPSLGGGSASSLPTVSMPSDTPAPATPAPTLTPSLAPPVQLGSAPAAPIPGVEEIAELRTGLATEIAGLNDVQLQLIAAADAALEAPVIDRLLLDAAARSAAIGDHATTVALAATTADQAGPIAAKTAVAYRDLATLAYLFVLDAHNLRDDVVAGTVPSDLAARVANSAARLWAPPDVGGAAPPDNPFQTRVPNPASIPTPIALGPKGVAVVNESVDPELEAIASVTYDRALLVAAIEVPAFTPPNVDLADPEVRALLRTADGQADSALARASAIAALTNLGATGMTTTARITSATRGASISRGARTAPQAGHISATVPAAMTVAGVAPASATQIGYAGQIRSYGGPLGIVTNGFEATDKNTIQYLGSEPSNPGTTTVVKVRITAIGPGNAAGRLAVEPGYEWFVVVVETEEAAAQPSYPWGKNGYVVICQGGVDNQAALLGPFGSVALKAKFGEPTTVQCFALPSIDGGLVLGASDRITVVLPGYGPDGDQDGVPDDDDRCPTAKEDRDQVQDTDGCPETDADADTVLDHDDECPETAGPSPTGCPPVDTDSDGVPDFKDKCPAAPEDKDRVADGDGCPESDADHDGIADEADKCPEEAEDIEGYQDDDGCREEDSDGDGIANVLDRCIYTGEIVNNYLDTDGCPDQLPVLTVADSFQETVTGTDLKSFASSLAMVFNPGTGVVSGVLSGVGEADVTFTCYEIANPSNIYDRATAHYVVSYQAPLSGSGGVGLDAPKKFTLKIAPVVTLKSTVTQFYTHKQCTHLNPASDTKVERVDGSGTLTVAIDPLGGTTAATKWSSSAGNVAGSYSGIAELSPADP